MHCNGNREFTEIFENPCTHARDVAGALLQSVSTFNPRRRHLRTFGHDPIALRDLPKCCCSCGMLIRRHPRGRTAEMIRAESTLHDQVAPGRDRHCFQQHLAIPH